MKPLVKSVLLASSICAIASPTSYAADSITNALKEGDVELSFRFRYEDVTWDGPQDSDAYTLKTRLTYKSASYNGWNMLLEMDDVTEVDEVDYRTAPNDPNNPGTAVIADPEGTEINQSWVAYTNGGNVGTYGRQRINLDDQRFVGGVGWRQNEQTYDSFSFKNTSVDKLAFFYSYVFNVNRIFGEANPIGDQTNETHLLNVNYSGWSFGTLAGFAYMIDNVDTPNASSDTIGVRFNGKAGNFTYAASYAMQSDGGDSTLDYDADYFLLEGATKLGPVDLGLGYELLGSDGGAVGFSTPLATLHKFQGWADIFLNTPNNGIEDIYINGGFTLGGAKFVVVYHAFTSDEGGLDYGSEIDFSVSKTFGGVGLELKYADYSADDFSVDTTKIWLTASAAF